MSQINISLTKWQVELLSPLFDLIKEMGDSGEPGCIHAQVFNDTEGGGFIKANVIDHNTSLKIQEITGVKIGQISKRTFMVYTEESGGDNG